MPHKQLKKNGQVQNLQFGMRRDMQQGQRVQPVQAPPREEELEAKKRGLEAEVATIEEKLMDISTREYQDEESLKNMKPVLEALSGRLLDVKGRLMQNPDSEDLQLEFAARKEQYSIAEKEAGILIKRLLSTKQEKYNQQQMHTTKMMQWQGEKITEEVSYQMTVEGLDKRIAAMQEYTQEPWKDCLEEIPEMLEKLKNTRAGYSDRIELTKTAKRMADDTADYKHGDLINEWIQMEIQPQEVIGQYLAYADRFWNQEAERKRLLSPEYITHHIRDSFLVIDFYLYFQARRKQIEIPEEQRKKVERADRIMEYYKEHVKNILSDHGLAIGDMRYDSKKIEALEGKESLEKQTARWKKDFQTYQELARDSEWQLLVPGNSNLADERLLALEQQMGIAPVHRAAEAGQQLEEAQNQEAEARRRAEEEARRQAEAEELRQAEESMEHRDGYYRYRSNILDEMTDYQNIADKKRRLQNVAQAMARNLQAQGLWAEDSGFARVLEWLEQDRLNHQGMNSHTFTEYEKRETEIRGNLGRELRRLLRTAPSSLEKQYAAELCTWFREEEDGDLVQPDAKKVIYRSDRIFKESNLQFKSAKDQPLFPHDPTLKDFGQGAVGDCFLIAAISSLVVRAPGKIKEIMKDNRDGTVTVRFYDRSAKKYLYVKVDKTIPEKIDENGRKKDRGAVGALWIKILEKAYASVRDKSTRQLSRRKGDSNYWEAGEGLSDEALTELTGIEAKSTWMYDKAISMFKGRLKNVNSFGDYKMETPALLYYEEMHPKDRQAFDYLNKHRVPLRKKAKLKAELKRNEKVEKLLEKVMTLEVHEMEINVMDREDFGEVMVKAYRKLEEYMAIAKTARREGHTLKLRDLAQTDIPETLRELLTVCWNLCEKQGSQLEEVASGMMNGYLKKINEPGNYVEDYTQSEEELFAKIKDSLDGGGYVEMGTRKFKVEKRQIQGTTGEDYLNGIFAGHAYAVLRTESHQIGNKVKKFLRMHNPHGVSVPLYQLGPDQKLKRVGFNPAKIDDEGIHYENYTHGVFLIELRDAKNFFNALYNSEKEEGNRT